MRRARNVDKRLLYDVVERAHSEGIGCRRLAWMVGYSGESMRRIARNLNIEPLAKKRTPSPSAELLRSIAQIKALADATN